MKKIIDYINNSSLKIDPINKVQKFSGTYINLEGYPDIYKELSKKTPETVNPEYDDKLTLSEYLGQLIENLHFRDLANNEQEDIINNIIFDYTEKAKESLSSSFPVINQIILDNNLKNLEYDASSK